MKHYKKTWYQSELYSLSLDAFQPKHLGWGEIFLGSIQ